MCQVLPEVKKILKILEEESFKDSDKDVSDVIRKTKTKDSKTSIK